MGDVRSPTEYRPLKVSRVLDPVPIRDGDRRVLLPSLRLNLVAFSHDMLYVAGIDDSNVVLSFSIERGGPSFFELRSGRKFKLCDRIDPHVANVGILKHPDGSEFLLATAGIPNDGQSGLLCALPLLGPAAKMSAGIGTMCSLDSESAWGLDVDDTTASVVVGTNSRVVLHVRLSYSMGPAGACISIEPFMTFVGHSHNVPAVCFGPLRESRNGLSSGRVLYSTSIDSRFFCWHPSDLCIHTSYTEGSGLFDSHAAAGLLPLIRRDSWGWSVCSLSPNEPLKVKVVAETDPLWTHLQGSRLRNCLNLKAFRASCSADVIAESGSTSPLEHQPVQRPSPRAIPAPRPVSESEGEDPAMDSHRTYPNLVDDDMPLLLEASDEWNVYPWASSSGSTKSGTGSLVDSRVRPPPVSSTRRECGMMTSVDRTAQERSISSPSFSTRQETMAGRPSCSFPRELASVSISIPRHHNPLREKELVVVGWEDSIFLYRVERGGDAPCIELEDVSSPYPPELRFDWPARRTRSFMRISQILHFPEVSALLVVQQQGWISVVRIVARQLIRKGDSHPNNPPRDTGPTTATRQQTENQKLYLIVEDTIFPSRTPHGWTSLRLPSIRGVTCNRRYLPGGSLGSIEVFVLFESCHGHADIHMFEIALDKTPLVQRVLV